MLRSLGIPARFSVGYSQGETALEAVDRPALGGNIGEDPGDFIENAGDQTTFYVRAKNLHSWPEVYFPGYGWIEFEPTVNQSPIVRPLNESEASQASNCDHSDPGYDLPPEIDPSPDPETNLPEDDFSPEGEPISLFAYMLTALIVIGTPVAIWRLLRSYFGVSPIPILIQKRMLRFDIPPPSILGSWARWSELIPLERSYHGINRSLRILGERQEPAISPSGRANKLVGLLPGSTDEIQELLGDYQDWLYGGQLINVKTSKQLARKIQIQAFLARLRQLGFKAE